MKNIRIFIKAAITSLVVLMFSSCSDWLKEPTPGQTNIDDYYTSWQAALENVNAAYVPLMWEYNGTYFSEWFIGDIVSDDALKGGQYIQSDMADVYEMENWKTQTDNELLLQYYRAKYQGIQRCNLVLERIPGMDPELFDEEEYQCVDGLQERIIGEAYFLRAFYYFQLVRVFGGVPLVKKTLTSDTEWQQPRATVDAVYDQIIEDLEKAEKLLWNKNDSRYDKAKDLGRVTKGAAQAMLLKANLYRGQYETARAWGDAIILSNEYQLEPNYADNWLLENENGVESVFEIQYMEDPSSDYNEGNGFSRGTFTQILTRSRSQDPMFGSNAGWGFNKPTHNLYDEYEEGDPRRDVTIWDATGHMTNETVETYCGTPYCSRKYAWYTTDVDGNVTGANTLAHASRGPLNYKLIRYADVLLMYAEACVGADGAGKCGKTAEQALNEVRQRARANAADPDALPDYPNYTIRINGTEIDPNLVQAIRHERRVELAMEGHRWFDICRWGGFDGQGVKAHMDAYAATESQEARDEMADFEAGKHELFPIPEEERALNPMDQNPGY